MATQRIDITLPQELVSQLRLEVPKRMRSKFIADTLTQKLKGKADIKKRLIASLKANYRLDEEISKEWEHIDLEDWPEWDEK